MLKYLTEDMLKYSVTTEEESLITDLAKIWVTTARNTA